MLIVANVLLFFLLQANVGERVKETSFIRILATAIFVDTIKNNKFVPDNLQAHYKLLQKYVDTNPNYELECLFALQSFIHKLEHPKGLYLVFHMFLCVNSQSCSTSQFEIVVLVKIVL